jgi:glutamyl-tRNA synthetase
MTNTNKKVKVRFPPSPTGEIHIGNMRTMLFNYLFAKKNNGEIVFRFEDTDKERSKKEFEEPMLQAYMDFGLSWDEGPYKQSERGEIYNKYLKLLVEAGLAYEAEENKKDGTRVVRLKNNERDIVWKDLVKGTITINTHTFKGRDDDGNFSEEGNPDIVIARNVNDAIYHFTVVIDDWLMGVTHVIRGEEHITSTPRQIMILEALRDLQDKNSPEVIIPEYAHLPIIVGADRKKLSKRTGTTSLKAFFEMGYLRETMINYLSLLGWNPGDEREFFSLEELIQEFSLERVQVSPAQFDFKKLDSINKHYLAKLSDEDLVSGVINSFPEDCREGINKNIDKARKIYLKVYRERISKFSEVYTAAQNGESDCYYDFSYDEDFKSFDINKLCFKGQSLDEAKNNLKLVLEILLTSFNKEEQNISANINWTVENLKNAIWDWSATVGRGQILHPLRMIMSLKDKSPDPFTIMEIIGKEESVRRMKNILS